MYLSQSLRYLFQTHTSYQDPSQTLSTKLPHSQRVASKLLGIDLLSERDASLEESDLGIFSFEYDLGPKSGQGIGVELSNLCA